MARERYPSDEARLKVRPHVKVHLTVATHRKTAAAWADLEHRAILVELWRQAGEAFAGKTGGDLVLTPAACAALAGRTQHAHNLRAIRALCARVGYAVREDGALVVVSVRNFAKKQGFNSARRGVTPATTPTSDSDSDSDSDSPSSKTQRGSASAEPDASPPKVERRAQPEISEEARELTRAFADSLRVPFPNARAPSAAAYAKWEADMDRLLRLDGRTPEQVASLVRWLYDPSPRASPDAVFWRANVQSVPKLRLQWDRLEACRARGKSNGKQTVADAAENVVRRFSAFHAERAG